MQDLTATHVIVDAHSSSHPHASTQSRHNSVLHSSTVHGARTSVEAHPIDDDTVVAQLRRRFSRLSSPSSSSNNSFVISGHPSWVDGLRTSRSRPRRHHHHDDQGRFCARLLACTPSACSASGTKPASAMRSREAATSTDAALAHTALEPIDEEEKPLKATVVGCYDDVNHTLRELRRAMGSLTDKTAERPGPRDLPCGSRDPEQSGFVWLDLHGVPSHAPTTFTGPTCADAQPRQHANPRLDLSRQERKSARALAPLWEYLAVSFAHREVLEAVQPQRRARAQTAKEPRRARRHHADLQMSTTDADTFSGRSAAPGAEDSTSSSSSSTSSDDEDERRRFVDAVGLTDLYDEQLEDVPDPDTVEIHSYNRPRTGVYADHYALLQLAAQLDEVASARPTELSRAAQTALTQPPESLPLTAEEGWTFDAAMREAVSADEMTLRHAGVVPSLTNSITAFSASAFERQWGAGSLVNLNASWARALSSSFAAIPTQGGLRHSVLGLAGTEGPDPLRRTSRLAQRHVGLGQDSNSMARGTGVGVVERSSDSIPIVGLYVLCFPNLCVTWCPSSTLSLAGAAARTTATTTTTHVVQGWETLQQAVFARVAHRTLSTARTTEPPICTATFLSALLTTVCSAYLPDTAAILSEVDAIDAMMPLIRPEEESDQADALRRVVLLRRKLSVHRRLLYQKVRLLASLDRPVVHMLTRFLIHAPHETHDSPFPRSAHPPLYTNGVTQNDHHVVRTSDVLSGAKDTPPMPTTAVDGAVRPIGSVFTSNVIVQHGSTRLVGDVLAAAREDANIVKPLRAALVRVHDQLESARVVLGNTTLIYSSSVARANSSTSTDSDFFQVKVSYISLIVMPLNVVVCHFGLNCMVPGQFESWPRSFTVIVVLLVTIMAAGAALPLLLRRFTRSDVFG